MHVKSEQIQSHLKRQLLPIYFVSGDEPLQIQETCDAIRGTCREQGFTEREIFQVDRYFQWEDLLASAANMSLFGDRKLIELRMPSAKPGDAGSKALVQYANEANPDNVLLIISDKIDKASQRTKWFTALDKHGAFIQIWPIDEGRLSHWMQQRLKQRQITIDSDALEMICDRVEGNMLAAVQEIDKLELLADGNHIDLALVAESVSNNARYNLFSTLDCAIAGRASDAVHMLAGLRAEGTEPLTLIWAIHRELNLLYRCREQLDGGQRMDAVLQANRVWSNRQSLVRGALQRLTSLDIKNLLGLTVAADQTIKGMRRGDPWQHLTDLLLGLAGVSLLTAAT
ncbi:MAG: DNA polymerase-3 subunit delta [Halieaceae bacterium]|jgi:DNA polymerase-3 subunit delta